MGGKECSQHRSTGCFQASLLAIPVANRCADLVFTFRVLHHFPRREDRVQVLSELARVSRRWVLTSWFDGHSLPVIRDRLMPQSRLVGRANLLIMPSLDAANIAYNLVKSVTGVVSVGPILIGPRLPAHIVTSSISTRGLVNMSAVACVQALDPIF